jgi:hypothetical protein
MIKDEGRNRAGQDGGSDHDREPSAPTSRRKRPAPRGDRSLEAEQIPSNDAGDQDDRNQKRLEPDRGSARGRDRQCQLPRRP